jgi:hypothetical protein
LLSTKLININIKEQKIIILLYINKRHTLYLRLKLAMNSANNKNMDELITKLGEGGSGKVYRVPLLSTESDTKITYCAVKFVNLFEFLINFLQQTENKNEFDREVEVLHTLK